MQCAPDRRLVFVGDAADLAATVLQSTDSISGKEISLDKRRWFGRGWWLAGYEHLRPRTDPDLGAVVQGGQGTTYEFGQRKGLFPWGKILRVAAAFAVTAAFGAFGSDLTLGAALAGTAEAFARAAIGSAVTAGVSSLVSGASFERAFWRNFEYSSYSLAGTSVVGHWAGGGVTGIGGNGPFQGAVEFRNEVGILKTAVTFGPGSSGFAAGSFREFATHELGHTAQFIGLSTLSAIGGWVLPTVSYAGMGGWGILADGSSHWSLAPGRWWESSATRLGGWFR